MSIESEEIAGLEVDILEIRNQLTDMKVVTSALQQYTAELARIVQQLEVSGNISTVTHISDRYRLVIERAASTKGVDGFKVECNGDGLNLVQAQAEIMYNYAKDLTNQVIRDIIEKGDG